MDEKLEEIFNRYKNDTTLEQPELVMAMLTELQDAAGYLSASIQKTAAQTAGVNAGYIAALVKTLPHLHAKPFKHEIKVCTSDRCKAQGGSEVLKKFQQILRTKPGQVSRDGNFLLTTEYCMHNCAHGPNVKIDGVLYPDITPSDVPSLIRKFSGKSRFA